MVFLSKEELKTVAQIPAIDKIINFDNLIVIDIIDESISLMKSYLGKYYDVELIFSKEGSERNSTILKYLKDIVIYEIYIRHTKEQNEVALIRYNNALNYLENLNTGKFQDSTLPILTSEDSIDGNSGDIRFGGNFKYTSKY
jgi:hypothetical protein